MAYHSSITISNNAVFEVFHNPLDHKGLAVAYVVDHCLELFLLLRTCLGIVLIHTFDLTKSH